MTAKHHIFISYSRTDAEVMQRVKDSFNASGIDVWTDTGIVFGTPNWQIAIEKAIEESVCVICILTPEAKSSRWVREELVYATFYEKPVYMLHASGDSKSVAILGFTVAQEVDVRDTSLYEPRMEQLIQRVKNHVQSKIETNEAPKFVNTQRMPEHEEIMAYEATADDETYEMLLSSIPPDENHVLIVQRGKEFTAQSTYDINDTFVTIGRNEKCRIFVNDASVSREHLQLIFTATGFLVRDLDSTNGTYINAERVKMRNLKHGDVLQVGLNVAFVYRKADK